MENKQRFKVGETVLIQGEVISLDGWRAVVKISDMEKVFIPEAWLIKIPEEKAEEKK